MLTGFRAITFLPALDALTVIGHFNNFTTSSLIYSLPSAVNIQTALNLTCLLSVFLINGNYFEVIYPKYHVDQSWMLSNLITEVIFFVILANRTCEACLTAVQ